MASYEFSLMRDRPGGGIPEPLIRVVRAVHSISTNPGSLKDHNKKEIVPVQCPKCKLENPASTQWCDCGYDFSTGKVNAVHKTATVRGPGEVSEGLTDGYFSFQKMISPTLIKVVYVIGMVGIIAAAIYMAFAGTKETEDTAKLLKVLSALLLAVVGNLLWRLVCEQVILLFSIHERLASIDRSLKAR
jgi:hypothetical protein